VIGGDQLTSMYALPFDERNLQILMRCSRSPPPARVRGLCGRRWMHEHRIHFSLGLALALAGVAHRAERDPQNQKKPRK
jgi:hypothetical protein